MSTRTSLHLPATTTEDDQLDVEKTLHKCFDRPAQPLHRDAHVRMLRTCIAGVAERFQGLHCSRPWLCYWILHAADLLGALDDVFATTSAAQIADFVVSYCLSEDAASSDEAGDNTATAGSSAGRRCGFGGGPGQIPHLAASYAAVCTLAICMQEEPVKRVDRDGLQRWLVSLRSADGGFRMHRGGEVDLRASFCAAVVATFFDLDMAVVFPREARRYIADSQTFEGGFSSCLDGGAEAHGGYTQCGTAAAILLGVAAPEEMDMPNLQRFCAMRQLDFEGGFCGRANKLVDSCYSFWIGASTMMAQAAVAAAKLQQHQQQQQSDAARLTASEVLLLEYTQMIDLSNGPPELLPKIDRIDPPAPQAPPLEEGDAASIGDLLFDQQELMHYVLQCCQQAVSGGLQDKPSAGVDFYHTCYSLSGLSIASNNMAFAAGDSALVRAFYERGWLPTNTPAAAAAAAAAAAESSDDATTAEVDAEYVAALRAAMVQPYSEADAMVGDVQAAAVPAPPTIPSLRKPAGSRKKAGPQATSPAPTPPQPVLALRPVNPVFNVCRDKVAWMWRVFRGPAAPVALLASAASR